MHPVPARQPLGGEILDFRTAHKLPPAQRQVIRQAIFGTNVWIPRRKSSAQLSSIYLSWYKIAWHGWPLKLCRSNGTLLFRPVFEYRTGVATNFFAYARPTTANVKAWGPMTVALIR